MRGRPAPAYSAAMHTPIMKSLQPWERPAAAGRLSVCLPRCLLMLPLLAFCTCVQSPGFEPCACVERLLVTMPARPDSWAALGSMHYRLCWRGADGLEYSVPVEEGGSIEIEVARGQFQPLLAVPEGAAEGLAPPGELYPEAVLHSDPYGLNAEPRAIVLNWQGGWLASLCLCLKQGGLNPESFNLEKLRVLASRDGLDPWSLKPASAALRLAENRFRSSLITSPKCFSVQLPGPGPWAPESPLAIPPEPLTPGGEPDSGQLAADCGSAAYRTSLPAGIWRFAGAEYILIMSIDNEGGALCVRTARP